MSATASDLAIIRHGGSQPSITVSPFLLTVMLAAGLHAGLLLLHFKIPERPVLEPSLDIMLVAAPQETTPRQETLVEEWQPDIPAVREVEPEPQPVTTIAPQPRQVTRLVQPEPSEASVAPEPAPALSAAALRRASLDAMRGLPELRLAPETIRRKYVSANTQEWKYVSYMRAWTDKVERVGNMNYPEKARRDGLLGTLIVSVGVMADGSLESVEILRSSGFEILDQAAIRIVELSAPYAALPEEIIQETDILYITRTWRFTPDQGLL